MTSTLLPVRSFALLGAFALALSGAPLTAQRTWIVDASGGPGHHFKNVPPAVAAASDGDTIVIRPGTYSFGGLTTSKALTILGASGVRFRNYGIFAKAVTFAVKGLPAGKAFVMKGVRVDTSRVAVMVDSCKGRVHLEGITGSLMCAYTPVASFCSGGIYVASSAQVTLAGCNLSMAYPVHVTKSHVVVSRSTLKGRDGYPSGNAYVRVPRAGTPGLQCADSTVVVDRCTLTGGAGIDVRGKTASSRPALVAANSSLTIAGDAADTYTAGKPSPGQTKGVSALVVNGGSLWLEGKVKLVPNPGAPRVAGTHRRKAGRPISLTVNGAPPGGVVAVTTISPAGERVWLLLGLPGAITPTSYGALWIDPGSMALLAATTQGSSEHWGVAVPVPNIPQLRGWVVMFQAFGGLGTLRAPFRLSSPGAAILD